MLKLYREDLDKYDSGSPCHISGMTFYLGRLGTKEAISQIQDIRMKLYGAFPNPKEVNDHEIMAKWLAEYGVKGWENVIDSENDSPMEYSKSFARQLFDNQSYWMSLNEALINHAVNFENYLDDEVLGDTQQIKKP